MSSDDLELSKADVWPNPLLPEEMSVDGPGEPFIPMSSPWEEETLRLYLIGLRCNIFPPPGHWPRVRGDEMIRRLRDLAVALDSKLAPAFEQMAAQLKDMSESIARWQKAYETAEEEDPLRKAIPKPSTTPPMWAVRPGARHRRHHG